MIMITFKKTVSQMDSDATATIIGSSLEDISDKTKDDSCNSQGMLKYFLFESVKPFLMTNLIICFILVFHNP